MAQTNMAFRFERAAALVGALVCCLVLAACSGRDGADKPPEPGDQAVARIDGRTVWVSDVKREAIAQGLIGEGEPLDITSDLFRRVMDEVVDQKLLAAEALKRAKVPRRLGPDVRELRKCLTHPLVCSG